MNQSIDEQRNQPKNDPKEIWGWLAYDWANSVFLTTVITALVGPYLTRLAQADVGENGVILNLGFLGAVTAKSMFSLAIGISVFGQVFLMPVLSALADYSRLKKIFMASFCYAGVVLGCLLYFIDGKLYLLGCVLVIFANICVGTSIVFYNAFLGEITTEDRRDKVSSQGFAIGYLGGGLVLLLNLLLLYYAESIGISQGYAVRLCFLTASLWWGGFAFVTFALLKSRGANRKIPAGETYISIGFKELFKTFRELLRLKFTLRYLIAYLFYNDGIQTVINQSSVFLAQELFVSRGLPEDDSFLLKILLLAQFTGLVGSFVFERIARRVGAKNAILISLVIWSGVVIYCYAFLQNFAQAWGIGATIGFVLGGSQALSRSLFSQMIPEGREASFFSLYEISERGTSWMGPIVFSVVVASTGSYRQAILALIFFFIVGSIILFFTNTDKAVEQAKQDIPGAPVPTGNA